jgi:hypothetical protein
MSDMPVLPERDVYTPHDVAVAVFGEARAYQGAKIVRDYLRAAYRRPAELKNTTWLLAPEVALECVEHLSARRVENVVTRKADDTNDA